LEFIFEIGYGTKASDHGDRFFLAGEFYEKSPEGGDLNLGCPRFVADAVLQKLDSLGGGEGSVFRTVFCDGDNYLVKEAGGPSKDIEMTQGCRVKRAGIDGASH